MKDPKTVLVLALLLVAAAFDQGDAQEAPYLMTRSFHWENDLVLSDKAYTNGLRYSSLVTAGPAWRTRVETRRSTRMLLLGMRPCPPGGQAADPGCYALRAGRAFGQNLYTPEALWIERPIPEDRPYGSYLYYGWLFEATRDRWTHEIEYDLGIMGPIALGESIQKGWHALGDWVHPEGWDHQIPNAPAASARVSSHYRLFSLGERESLEGIRTRSLDVTPFAHAVVGTPITHLSGGATVRIGRNIGSMPRRIEPAIMLTEAVVLDRWIDSVLAMPPGIERRHQQQQVALAIRQNAYSARDLPRPLYLFASAGVVAVGHNAFLEGPLVGISPPTLRPASAVSPPMRRAYGEVEIGGVLGLPGPCPAHLTLRLVSRGPEFDGGDSHRFLALSVGW